MRGDIDEYSDAFKLSFKVMDWCGDDRAGSIIYYSGNEFVSKDIRNICVRKLFPFVRIIIRSYCPFVLFKNQLTFDKSDRRRLIFIGIGGMKGKIYMFSYNRKCDV